MADYPYNFTNAGLTKRAAHHADPINNPAVNITQIALGDGNGSEITPAATMTTLVNEVFRCDITNRGVKNDDPTVMFFAGYMPKTEYGYIIRECGLFDNTGTLIAIRKYPVIDKTLEGNGIDIYLQEELKEANTADFDLTVDASQIMATQEYVQNEMSDHINDADAHAAIFANYYTKPETDNIIERLCPLYAKPLAVLSGNTDNTTGLPDIINKVSDTEVSFLVGGIYKNLIITDSKCKKYEISSIENLLIPTDAGIYIFIIDFTNLVLLDNGTYSAIATAVNLGYTGIESSPAMTSNSSGGFDVKTVYTTIENIGQQADGGNAYKICDQNTNTSYYVVNGSGAVASTDLIIKKSDNSAFKITRLSVLSTNLGYPTAGAINGCYLYGSNNSTNGVDGDWTLVSEPNNPTGTPYDVTSPNDYAMYKVVASVSRLGGVTSPLSIELTEVRFWHEITYEGGSISEGYVLPANPTDGDYNILINEIPCSPQKRISGTWTDREFVKIGEANRAVDNGVLGMPRNHAFNCSYDSGLIAVTGNNTYTFNHNLNTKNVDFELMIADDADGTNERPAVDHYYTGTHTVGWLPTLTTKNSISINFIQYVGVDVSGGKISSAYFRLKAKRSW